MTFETFDQSDEEILPKTIFDNLFYFFKHFLAFFDNFDNLTFIDNFDNIYSFLHF